MGVEVDPNEIISTGSALSKLGVTALLGVWAVAASYIAYKLGMRLIESLEIRNKEARENGGMAQQCAAALQQMSDSMRLLATKGSD